MVHDVDDASAPVLERANVKIKAICQLTPVCSWQLLTATSDGNPVTRLRRVLNRSRRTVVCPSLAVITNIIKYKH